MQIVPSIVGVIVLIFTVGAWMEVAKGPSLNAPLLRRKFLKKAIPRLMGAMFAVLLLFKLCSLAASVLLPQTAWAGYAAVVFWASLSCIGLWYVRRNLSRLRSELR